MRKVKDIAVKVGEYTDNQGKTKGRYKNVGGIMENDDGGSFILLDRIFNPAGVPDLTGRGGDAVLISIFDIRDSNSGAQRGPGGGQRQSSPPSKPAPSNQPSEDEEDDIPF
jgi:hypothetical protein